MPGAALRARLVVAVSRAVLAGRVCGDAPLLPLRLRRDSGLSSICTPPPTLRVHVNVHWKQSGRGHPPPTTRSHPGLGLPRLARGGNENAPNNRAPITPCQIKNTTASVCRCRRVLYVV